MHLMRPQTELGFLLNDAINNKLNYYLTPKDTETVCQLQQVVSFDFVLFTSQ